ncbi:MAG TPA: 3-hydroxyacyl-CoA dehydrogenase NAD-binding domain-containing protein [Prolixibacteraceae bacterium]|nr:3-hydroxyacyl-CoA dehydrogenase NAD-binding domain-containing protein [Prolixibacteraceae bacterium]
MAGEIIREPIEDFGLSKKGKSNTLFSKIGIVGCGLVGQNLARVAAYYGIEVIFIEVSQEKIDEAFAGINKMMDHRIQHWGLTESEKRAHLSRIQGTIDYNMLKDCDFVVEAIRAVDRGIKVKERKEIFKKIEAVVDRNCIIATNSTTVIITELASDLEFRDRCISIHFFVNSPEARIMEVTKGLYTSDECYNKVCKFVKLINRTIVPVEESAGLVSIRIFVVALNEACELLLEGVSNLEDIDTTMKIGFGMRQGLFEVADRIGLDKVVRWMENIYGEFGDVRYKPSPYIKKLVRAKHMGVTTGQGFYLYDEKGVKIPVKPRVC